MENLFDEFEEATPTMGNDQADQTDAVELEEMGIAKSQQQAASTSPQVDDGMQEFFSYVNDIKEKMNTIRRNTRNIKELANELVEKPFGEEAAAKKSKELNQLITVTNSTADRIRNMLKAMKESNVKFINSHSKTDPLVRIRTNMHGTLCKNFTDLMRAYNDVQTEYQSNAKEKLSRQCKYVNPDLSEEEIDKIVESGDAQVFKDGLMEINMQEKATQALAYVENKHNDIVRLTESVKELHQLFVDLATLVDNQDELIDDIEMNCHKASEYVEKGVENLHKANVLQKKSRKKMCCLIVLIIIIVVVVVVLSVCFGGGFVGSKDSE